MYLNLLQMLAIKIYDVGLLLQAMAAVAFCCRYQLVEQPPNTMACNPYPSGMFITRCAVEVSTTVGGPLNFTWYLRTRLGSAPQLIPSGFVFSTLVESTLTVHLQNGTESTCGDFRAYFCRVSFLNGTILSDSQEVYLFPQYAISSDLKNCDKQSVQSSRTATCVDLNFSTAKSTTPPSLPITISRSPSTTTTLPPTATSIPVETTETMTTTSSQPPTTTTSNTVAPRITTSDRTSLPTKPSRPLPMTSTPPSQVHDVPTTPLLHPQNSITTTTELGSRTTTFESPPSLNTTSTDIPLSSANVADTSTGDDSPFFNLDDIFLYLAIGAVIVLIMIVITLLLCLCLWNRVCQKSKYCTCCS